MPDGTVLLADIWHPVGVASAPTILERTPYGRWRYRRGTRADRRWRSAAPLVLQAVRGTDGSGGSQSFFAERDDGRATADWITRSPGWTAPRHLRVELHGLHAVGAGVDCAVVPEGHGHLAVVEPSSWYLGARSRSS